MTLHLKTLFAGAAALAATAALAPAAWAGCGGGGSLTPATWTTPGQSGLALTRIDYGRPPIAGLWSVTLTSASGQNNDWGFAAWNSDGTEIMNSGGHAPASGNFCMGAWAQTAPNVYHLNHWALAYVPSATPPFGTLAAKINLKETVSLSGPNAYSGTFTMDIYVQPSGPHLTDHGTITATRVMPF